MLSVVFTKVCSFRGDFCFHACLLSVFLKLYILNMYFLVSVIPQFLNISYVPGLFGRALTSLRVGDELP